MQILAERKSKHLWITGHSLGGALAVACAYDLAEFEALNVDGLITFGQPMVAKRELATYIDKLLHNRYARFVKNEDIVPRVPPSYVDCGSLVWFKPEGIKRSPPKLLTVGAASSSSESKQDAIEKTELLKPMSDDEFEKLQAFYRSTRDPILGEDGNKTYTASRDYIADHSMTGYVHEVRTMLGMPSNK